MIDTIIICTTVIIVVFMVLVHSYIIDSKINILKDDKICILDEKKEVLENLDKYHKSVYSFTTAFNKQYGDKYNFRLFTIDKDVVIRNFPNTDAIEIETYDE
jgi:hypothetical protein